MRLIVNGRNGNKNNERYNIDSSKQQRLCSFSPKHNTLKLLSDIFHFFHIKYLQELEERQRSLHEAEMKRQQVEKDLAHRENIALQRQKIPLNTGEKTNNLYEPDGNGLKRRSFSHSSPNIAKMMEDEDDTSPGMASGMN